MRSVRCSRSARKPARLLGQQRAGVVDVVAEDVQFASHRRALVDGGDLDGRDDAHAEALARLDRLGDAADGVVVAQREQLDAGLGGALDDLGGRQGAVGVGRVGLQVKARRHAREPMRSTLQLAGRSVICRSLADERVRASAGTASCRLTRRSMPSRRRRTAAW